MALKARSFRLRLHRLCGISIQTIDLSLFHSSTGKVVPYCKISNGVNFLASIIMRLRAFLLKIRIPSDRKGEEEKKGKEKEKGGGSEEEGRSQSKGPQSIAGGSETIKCLRK